MDDLEQAIDFLKLRGYRVRSACTNGVLYWVKPKYLPSIKLEAVEVLELANNVANESVFHLRCFTVVGSCVDANAVGGKSVDEVVDEAMAFTKATGLSLDLALDDVMIYIHPTHTKDQILADWANNGGN